MLKNFPLKTTIMDFFLLFAMFIFQNMRKIRTVFLRTNNKKNLFQYKLFHDIKMDISLYDIIVVAMAKNVDQKYYHELYLYLYITIFLNVQVNHTGLTILTSHETLTMEPKRKKS